MSDFYTDPHDDAWISLMPRPPPFARISRLAV